MLRTAWSDPRPGNYVRGTSVCLSSLLAARRHQELLEVLALRRFPFWPDRKFGMQALLDEGRMEEALAYAEASRGVVSVRARVSARENRDLIMAHRSKSVRPPWVAMWNA